MNHQANLTDEQLIQYFLNGDPKAMATLVELYKDRIYTSIYSIVQDKYQAEEIFQAVFIRIIDNMIAGKQMEEGKFLSWAMHIAHGLCIDHKRKSTAAEITAGSDNLILNNFITPALVSNAITYDCHGKIRTMIDMLPGQQREVIVLNHYSGLSLTEIASLLKCSVTSALEIMRFALRNLGKLMVEKEVYC